jgi:ABC-type glycerol-3-phosphate transport system permease component
MVLNFMKRWSLSLVLLLIVIAVNFPVIVLILNSFKSTAEILSSKNLFPVDFTFGNYQYLANKTKFASYFKNSVFVSVLGTLLNIVIASLAGYALSRYRSLSITIYSRSLLIIQMFPIILILVPLFALFLKLHLINTYFSVIILYATIQLPFSTWMFKAFFDAIPKDLEESSWIDGCTRINTLIKIILPLSGPGIVVVSIHTFINSWNEFLIASIFLKDEKFMTIPVGIQSFMQLYASDWGLLMASATLAIIPSFGFFLFVQKHMVSNSIGSSMKG